MTKVATTLFAVIAGFAAGILLAPKSGKETQAEIKRKAQDMGSKANDSFQHISDEAKQSGRRLKTLAEDSVENLKGNAKIAADDVRDTAKTAANEAKKNR